MKPFYFACLMLALLLALSLWNAQSVSRYTTDMENLVFASQDCAEISDWENANASLKEAYRQWEKHQTYFHIIIQHEELDAAQSLFRQMLVLCDEQDAAQFRITAADLLSQLRLLRELEEISIKNIL